MNKADNVENVSFSGTPLRLRVDDKDWKIDIARHSDRLANAMPEQRSDFVVSFSGYGIHWLRLDKDLSIDGLMGIEHTFGQTRAIV